MSEFERASVEKRDKDTNRGNDARKGRVQYDNFMPDQGADNAERNRRDGAAQVSKSNYDVVQLSGDTSARQKGGAQENKPLPTPAQTSNYDQVPRQENPYDSPTSKFANGDESRLSNPFIQAPVAGSPSGIELKPKAVATEKGVKAVEEDRKKQPWDERHTTAVAIGSFFGGLAMWGGLAVGLWALVSYLADPDAEDDLVDVDFQAGQPLSCEVVANDGPAGLLDKASVRLIDGDANADGKTKTVAGVGVWTVGPTDGFITFTPDAALKTLPLGGVSVGYTVKSKNSNKAVSNVAMLTFRGKGDMTAPVPPTTTTAAPTTTMTSTTTTTTTTTTAAPALKLMDFFVTVRRRSGFSIDFNQIAKDYASLNLDPASALIVDANNKGVTSLPVSGAGTFAVSTSVPGTVTFTPVSGFSDFPAPVRFTIANKASVRSEPFQISFRGVVVPTANPVAVHEDLPAIDFDAPQVAGRQPGNIPAGFAQVTIVVAGTLAMPGSATPGGLPIDAASVEIVGPISSDGGMPAFTLDAAKKKLVVDGEGTWTVTSNGNIEFSSAENFVRWPTPIGYTVKDTEGNISNAAAIAINPELKKLQDGIENFLTKTDDDFWTEFAAEVINSASIPNDGSGLKKIRLIVHTLWATINSSFNVTNKAVVYAVPRYTEQSYAAIKAQWMAAKLSKSGLLTATAGVTNTSTFLFGIPLGTRLIRLEIIRRLITEVYPPSNT